MKLVYMQNDKNVSENKPKKRLFFCWNGNAHKSAQYADPYMWEQEWNHNAVVCPICGMSHKVTTRVPPSQS
jgi:transcription elongation factor Elf1